MYIPLDRLYHFIESVANEIYHNPVIIYRFWPHGSKNIQDINPLKQYNWAQMQQMLGIWCHDQEPLATAFAKRNMKCKWGDLLDSLDLRQPRTSLNWYTNVFKKNILLHSEKRSFIVDKYLTKKDLIPVYYWSHAVIALDWFRYAKHQDYNKNISKKFLVYNRAWSGTREYRLRFTDLLIDHRLIDQCLTFYSPTEDGKHYTQHNYNNNVWRPTHVLEKYLPPSLANACASADFDAQDYKSTEIEVVLETLFDDDRLHLTEKSLRPIACAQPFILAGTHGSLEYLRSYGFKTFGDVWDESYDLVEDPAERLTQIAELMKQIANWDSGTRENKLAQARQIAQYNRDLFFSDRFFSTVSNELRDNLGTALEQSRQVAHKDVCMLIQFFEKALAMPEIQNLSQETDIDAVRQTLDHMKSIRSTGVDTV